MRARLAVVLLTSLAACGKTHSLSDAGTGDGNGADSSSAIDAASDAAPGIDADLHGVVTVIVYDVSPPKTPLDDVPVVFVEPDGTIAAEVRTDASGTATASVLPGASVTAIYGDGTTQRQLETVRAVSPGDTIKIGPLNSGGGGSGSGSFTANVPDDPGSLSYDVYGPCGASSGSAAGSGALTPVSLSISDNCALATMDLVAIAFNSDRNADAWLEQKNVAYTNGGNTTMPAAWQAFQTLTATYTNVPFNVGVIYLTDSAPDANGYQVATYSSLGQNPSTATLSVPGAATALIETNFSGKPSGEQQLYDRVDGTATAYTVDLGTALLPFISNPTLDVSTATFSVGGGGGGGDVLDATMSWSRVINDATTSFSWEVWSPPTDAFALPAMPVDLADDYPIATDTVDSTYATLIGADAITDWSQIRGQLFGAFDAYYAGRASLGRFIISYPTGVGFVRPRR